MNAVPKKQAWQDHYAEGKGFRQAGEVERTLLAAHTPAPDGGGRALDVGCGTGELAVTLAGMGYTVDAVDYADAALKRARAKIADGPDPADRRSEFFIHAFGPAGPALAERFASCVRTWDREVRESWYPALSIHPAGTPDDQLPPGDRVDAPACRMVFDWPGRGTRAPLPAPAPSVAASMRVAP
ncbi:class I SAM-dependent methyltransferase [Streptomyces californicus]|uniref:class I SAM-dependent methyltransferase n=1 Tax=Streptomyces californicus TaxID=67351 RepID=UPI003710EA97